MREAFLPPRPARPAYRVSVDPALCDGCGICVFFCKPSVFEMSREMNRRGVFVALPTRVDACTFCRLCDAGCPQLAVTVRADQENR
jgi:NAD-dependent dihydropyrimidine dehydrogenase PreA subunit